MWSMAQGCLWAPCLYSGAGRATSWSAMRKSPAFCKQASLAGAVTSQFFSGIPRPNDQGLRIALLVSVVSGVVIFIMTVCFIVCCCQEHMSKKKENYRTGRSRRKEKRSSRSRRSPSWLEREQIDWEAFPPPKLFSLSQHLDRPLPPGSPVYSEVIRSLHMSRAEKRQQTIRLPLEITTFFLGFPSNVVLLWLLTMGSKALSPSEVLGLNLACLNIIFCLSLPADVYLSTGVRSGQFLLILDAFSVLNIFGCPLLLTSMCLERYLAVAHAVLYMKLASKWEYRAICSILIWISTLAIAGLTLHQTLPKLVLYLSNIITVFLLVMLACLIGIVLELCKKGPGAGQTGPGGGSSMKMRALQNTLLVLFPSFIIYAPLLGLSPFMMTLTEEHLKVTSAECDIMHLFHVYPNLGTCIGPMFYISRVKQLLCQRRHDAKEQSSSQETKQPK